MSNVALIRKLDISNGEGNRVSVFFSGCNFHCKNCHNEIAWDFKKGEPFNEKMLNKILLLCDREEIKGLSILGGEPLDNYNVSAVRWLCIEFNKRFPNKDIWLWTGYTWEELMNGTSREAIRTLIQINVLIDGRYVDELRDITLNNKWRGSTNQRIIDVQKSLEQNNIVLYDR